MLLDGNKISFEDVIKVARKRERIKLSEEAKKKINIGRKYINSACISQKPIYGVSTGFGFLQNKFIDSEDRIKLQYNLIRSHATGVGAYLEEDVVRATIFLKVISLIQGVSGVRIIVVEKLIELLNKDIYPAMPSKGSVGASGDLVPLAHVALVLLGEGLVIENGVLVKSKECFQRRNIVPLSLMEKEGLSLINGTQVMTAIAALICYDARILLKCADISAALSIEALQGDLTAFDFRIINCRPHKGALAVTKNICSLMKNSGLKYISRDNVQDAYSLRCIPQVHGASRAALSHAEEIVLVEINATTDNPIVILDTGEVLCGGNFHGQPIALVMDYLKIAISEIGNISERRLNRLLDSHLSHLPDFLANSPGINSGLMITQYTAAALVSENKVLSHPASVDSIPLSANQEDHVSMGTIAARQLRDILNNVSNIIAIEMLAALQGIDMLKPYPLGLGTQIVYNYIRKNVKSLNEDRILHGDIDIIRTSIIEGTLLKNLEDSIGELE